MRERMVAVEVGDGAAFTTGYYEPQIAGCRTRRPGCETPIYRPPPDLLERNPLTGERMDNLFSTHPATENRIAAPNVIRTGPRWGRLAHRGHLIAHLQEARRVAALARDGRGQEGQAHHEPAPVPPMTASSSSRPGRSRCSTSCPVRT